MSKNKKISTKKQKYEVFRKQKEERLKLINQHRNNNDEIDSSVLKENEKKINRFFGRRR